MAMLAEPRQRKRYNLVPRGKALYEDESRFGTKMLEKMGWEKGKGLGANEDGTKDFIRIRYKNDALGLGFEHRDDQWTQHEQSFNGLLKSLNNEEDDDKEDSSRLNEESGNGSEDEMPRVGFGFQDSGVKEKKKQKVEKLKEKISGVSLEERSKQSKARVHYKKFTRGKDLAQYSEKDLANIFGKKAADDQQQAVNDFYQQLSNTFDGKHESVNNSNGEDEPLKGVQIINTGISVNDYFKTKMEALKKRKNTENLENDEANFKDALSEEDVSKKKKKKKKDKKDQDQEKNAESAEETQQNNGLINSTLSVNDYFKMKMEALKRKKISSNNEENAEESEVTKSEEINKKKKKSEKKNKELNNTLEAGSKKEESETKKEKKSKKTDIADTLEIPEEEANTKKKKNKTKKRTFEEIEPQNEDILEANAESTNTEAEPSKKKQKKSKKTNEIIETNSVETEIKVTPENETNKKKKKSKKLKENSNNEENSSSSNTKEINEAQHTSKTSKNAKRKDVSFSANKALSNDVNLKLLDLEELKKKYNDFNIYPLSSFCAEKFRNISLNDFKGSILPQIEGYGLGPELQLDVHVIKNDEERITNLWKGVLSKYTNLEKPKKTYQHYVRNVIKARITKQKAPKLYVKTWKRKNAFQII